MNDLDDFLSPESGISTTPQTHTSNTQHDPFEEIEKKSNDLPADLFQFTTTTPEKIPNNSLSSSSEVDMMTFLIDTPGNGQENATNFTQQKQNEHNDSFFDDLIQTPKGTTTNNEEENSKQSSLIADHDNNDINSEINNDPFNTAPIETTQRPKSPLEQDFLSWLDDSNPVGPSSTSAGANTNIHDTSLGGVMDDFFEEVFGEKSPDSSSLRQNSSQSSHPTTPNNFSLSNTSSSSSSLNLKRFDTMLRAEASSGFPDLSRIRDVIFGAGYLPQSCRSHVWSVLLVGGSVVEDQEAEFWRPSGRDENIENYSQLKLDCEALVKRAAEKSNLSQKPTNSLQCKDDLHDILLLYCIRKKAAYRSLLCDILSPLIFVPAPYNPPSRSLSSSCFYSLTNNFIPLINLPATAYSRAIKTVHNWLHLLLSYHFPRLTQHLDRVFPGWESAIHDSTPAEITNKRAYDMKSAELDRLERELGLVGDDNDDENKILQSSEGQVIQSVRPSDRRVGGCVSSLWLCGIFGGCVPALYSCWLTDWAILHGDRYAGIFFTAAFFGIYSNALLSMDGANIRKWIDKVLVGETNWFNLLHLPLARSQTIDKSHDFLSDNNSDMENEIQVDWESFTRGWIHAAASLKSSTPQGFIEAFEDMESWALAYSEINDEFDGYDSHHHQYHQHQHQHTTTSPSNAGEKTVDKIKAKGSFLLPSSLLFSPLVHLFDLVGEKSIKLMQTMRRLRQKVKKGVLDHDSELNHQNNNSSSHGDAELIDICHQESKQNYHCLWSTAAEVIPCICSSQRKPNTTTRDMLSSFRDGCEWTPGKTEMGVELKGGEGMSFPSLENLSNPFYFGVDIRSQSEMALGRFPKAYCLDPRSLTDPDLIADCLTTLEPMSQITHLCIIGVGEEYIRQQQFEDVMAMSLDNMLAEYHNVLMSVAVFFMKKGFNNVSVLDGGFVAAVRYLMRDDCPYKMATALVDVNVTALDKLLGPGTCEKYLGTKRSIRSENPPSREPEITPSLSAGLAAVGSFVANVTGQPPAEVDTKQVLEDIGKKLTLFGSSTFATFKRVGAMGVATVASASSAATSSSTTGLNTSKSPPPPPQYDDGGVDHAAHGGSTWKDVGAYDERNALTFVIDEDEEDEDNENNQHHTDDHDNQSLASAIPDTTKISITKTEAEKQQALAVHKLSGVKKGDQLIINKDTFPGAILFPAMKEKEVIDENGQFIMVPGPDGETLQPVTASVHRYLVITKERFIVLDSNGKGVGSTATVKSNHHLTELIKITFKKRDPELVTLFYASPNSGTPDGLKKHQYRVIKRKEFVDTLQRNMVRFK